MKNKKKGVIEMKRIAKTTVGLAVILVLFGMMMGCGKKISGKYVNHSHSKGYIELKDDGRAYLDPSGGSDIFLMEYGFCSPTTGKWKIHGDELALTFDAGRGEEVMKCKIKDSTLIDSRGDIWQKEEKKRAASGKIKTGEKKYIGDYVGEKDRISDPHSYMQSKDFLEIKEDRTWQWKIVYSLTPAFLAEEEKREKAALAQKEKMEKKPGLPYVYVPPEKLTAPNPIICDGEWEIWGDKILLYRGRSRSVHIEGELVGDELVDRKSGMVFVRQGRDSGKKSEMRETKTEKTERVSQKLSKAQIKAREKLVEMGIEYSEDEKDNKHEFFECLREENTKAIELFLAAGIEGIDPNVKDEYHFVGWPALMVAARSGNVEITRLLLAKGADVNAKNNDGETVLMRAMLEWGRPLPPEEQKYNVIPILLGHGADVNAKDKDGWTALMYAANRGYFAMVQTLLAKGADVNAKNNDGRTALMILLGNSRASDDAMEAGARGFTIFPYNKTIQLLLAKGADVDVIDNNNETVLELAKKNWNREIINLLKEAGAEETAEELARELARENWRREVQNRLEKADVEGGVYMENPIRPPSAQPPRRRR